MVSSFKAKIFAVFSLFLLSLCTSFAATDLEFTQTEYSTGEITLIGSASSGTKVTVNVNGNFLAQKDILAESQTILLEGDITSYQIPVGTKLTLQNNEPGRTYQINIQDGPFRILNFGQSVEYISYTVGDVLITDEETGDNKVITVTNEMVDFSFEGAHDYMDDGLNKIEFVVTEIGGSESNSYEFDINYDKYTNRISLSEFQNITNGREIRVSGTVTNSASPLYYVLNIDGQIANPGILKEIPLDGNKFNTTITSLSEGTNLVRLITTDPNNSNLFNGEKFFNAISDTIKPDIEIIDIYFRSNANSDKKVIRERDNILSNSGSIILNISSDANYLNYTFNDKEDQTDIVNGLVELELNLKKGQNNLTLEAIDIAGNTKKEAHQIIYDNEKPELIRDSLSPEEFWDGDARFFFQKIKGRTNKPNVKMTIFTIVEGTEDFDGNDISCNNFDSLFERNLGQLNNDRTFDTQLDLNETQYSLLGLVSKREMVTSDSQGNWDAIISLNEKNFDRGDFENYIEDNSVNSVKSRNTLCIFMEDKFGNVGKFSRSVTLDAGNTLWKAGEVTTIPNTLYAAEIEQSGDVRSGSGNVGFGMTVRFEYIGPGKVNDIQSFTISKDGGGSEETKYARLADRAEYYFDAETDEMIVYVPVEIEPLGIKPLEYPEKLDFAFKANVRYTVGEEDIPVDEVNPIYFQTSINLERPLDHAKWLTPETIEDIQGFLNNTIKATKKFSEAMQSAAVVGVAVCTYKKFEHVYKINALNVEYSGNKDSQEYIDKKAEYDRDLYMWCDRVASTASPYLCDGDSPGNYDKNNIINLENPQEVIEFSNNGRKVGVFEPKFGGRCDYPDGDNDKQDGIYVRGEGKKFENGSDVYGVYSKVEAEIYVNQECYPLDEAKENVDIGKLNSNFCYTEGAPSFDETRCNFFGQKMPGSYGDHNGVPGKDPATSIISSIWCGSITNTYSHSKTMLRVQEGIYQCMEEAKLGVVKGSYCERLLGQAVCDVATNVILPEIQQNLNPRGGAVGGPIERGPLDFLKTMKENEREFDKRYQGTLFSQSGLGTDQIINKACLGAITGDWSILTDNILSSIEDNEVKPVFGPPFAESRIQGLNQITGELSLRYFFTYGAISGGQRVDTEVELLCNPNAPNNRYCPENALISSKTGDGGRFKAKKLFVNRGQSKQEGVIITDSPASLWYNEIKFTHEYELNGETKRLTETFPIIHKEELPISCYFSEGIIGAGGAKTGIQCNPLFSPDEGLEIFKIDDRKTEIIPTTSRGSSAPFYSGNSVYADVYYNARNNEGFLQDNALVYMTVCNEGTDRQFSMYKNGDSVPEHRLGVNTGTTTGREVVELYENLPEIGASGGSVASINIAKVSDGGEYGLKFVSLNTAGSPTYEIESITLNGEFISGETGGYIPQNFNINSQDPQNPSYQFLKFEYDKIKDGGNLRITFKEKLQNIDLYYSKKDGDKHTNEQRFNPTSGSYSEGTCNVYMKILPLVDARQVTASNFFTYNPAAQSNDEGDIFTNVEIAETVKKSFQLKKNDNPAVVINNLELTDPYESQVICYNPDDNSENNILDINFKGIWQNSADKYEKDKVRMVYTLSSNRFVLKYADKDKLSSEGQSISEEDFSINIKIPESDNSALLEELLKSQRDGLALEEQFVGTGPQFEFILNYRFEEAKVEDNKRNYERIKEDERRFILIPSDNCYRGSSVLEPTNNNGNADVNTNRLFIS